LNSDVRISVGLLNHAKVLRLLKRHQHAGLVALITLWIYAAAHRPNGWFPDIEEIELAAQWGGRDGDFAAALLDLRLLDSSGDGGFQIHNWERWNPWVAGATDRSELARRNVHKRYCLGRGACDKAYCENATPTKGERPNTSRTTAVAGRNTNGTTPPPPPSPSPLPNPSPTPEPPPAQTTQQKAVADVTALFAAASVAAPPPALVAQWLQRHAWDAAHVSALVSRYVTKGTDYLTKVVNNPTNQKSASANGAGENDDKFAALVADIPVHRL
jgi:hypothetical protein